MPVGPRGLTGEMYATPAVRGFKPHEYLIFYAPSPWARYMMRTDWVGDHARWEVEMARKYGPGAKMRWRDTFKQIRVPPGLVTIEIPWWAQLGGWLIGLWACWEALRS